MPEIIVPSSAARDQTDVIFELVFVDIPRVYPIVKLAKIAVTDNINIKALFFMLFNNPYPSYSSLHQSKW